MQPKPNTTCFQCGIPIYRDKYQIKRGRNICSKQCEISMRRNRVDVACSGCGAALSLSPFYLERYKHHFCSQKCHGKWRSENQRTDANPVWKGRKEPVLIPCANCGQEIRRPRFAIEQSSRSFCSRACQAALYAGERHPNWIGGSTKYYGANWREQRNLARRRDGYRCQCCGKTQKQNGRQLDVHHIKPFHVFGYVGGENTTYLDANHLSNLISLCRNCHLRVERGNRYVQRRLV